MKSILKLVTILCYFLPFTFFLATCNGSLNIAYSYNQKEADKNLQLAKQFEEAKPMTTDDTVKNETASSGDTTLSVVDTSNSPVRDRLYQKNKTRINSDDTWDKISRKIIMPSGKSLSGIGVVFYGKNMIAQSMIATSLFLSLITLFLFRQAKFSKTRRIILAANTLSIMVFIADSFLSEVTLLWGTWILLSLLSIQLIIDLINAKQNSLQH